MTRPSLHRWAFAAAIIITAAVYWPGLSGNFLFDDYPNIVDNHGVQPAHANLASLVNAALSSPASEFKRPLASLSFAINYLASGRLDPYGMKLTNLVIHLLNGLLVFLLTGALLRSSSPPGRAVSVGAASTAKAGSSLVEDDPATKSVATEITPTTGFVATLVASSWMLLPINLTGVLYVVQRMESMANLFVLLGLIGYVAGRHRMLAAEYARSPASSGGPERRRFSPNTCGFILCAISITVPAAIGILAKETAVMLPLYALLIEWILFEFRTSTGARDRLVIGLFVLALALPAVLGMTWLLPGILSPGTWASRDFTLGTRLLSEARIIPDYIVWTLLPTPNMLSFYHDDFHISTGLLAPWETLASIMMLAILGGLMLWLRSRQPLTSLGIALFLGCQLLTGTILPLELIYEHRNYFASFGLLLAIVPLLAAPRTFSFALPRYVLMAGLMLCWLALTALTAYAWGNPLRLAEDLAARAPHSSRAQYELGRTYIIYSHYDPASPFTQLAYAPLEQSAALPNSSILAEQALIFMNARMHLPLKNVWWDSMIAKLKAHKPGVQDESSLGTLTQCARNHQCDLPKSRMMAAYLAALSHPNPNARLLAMYGDYAWNVLDDHALGERMTEDAVKASPREPAYRITLVQMLAVQGRKEDARAALHDLQALDIGGSLDSKLRELRALPDMQ